MDCRMGYVTSVKKDIVRWRERGLIDAATADALRGDIEANRTRGVSFGAILAILAAVLLGAALLLLIAANWELLPRLVRLGLIVMLLLAGYLGGAWLKVRGRDAFAEAFWIVAAAAFGGGIALVGQMYHLSGDETQAVLVWCGGTVLAATLLRSGPLTVASVLLAAAWMVMMWLEHSGRAGPPWIYLALSAGLWLVSLWTRNSASRHLVLLSLILFAALHYLESESLAGPSWLILLSAGLFVLSVVVPEPLRRYVGLDRSAASVLGLVGFVSGVSLLQAEFYEKPEFLFLAILVFAGIVSALVLGGRESRMLRWLAYAAFAAELAIIYLSLIGTMLGTAGFFLAAGIMLAVSAWLIGRLERRLGAGEAGAEP